MNTRHLRPEDLRGRWRGYIRVSTEPQAEKWSPDRQRADIERAAAELGLVPAEPRWYERTGSGESRSEELLSALADARAGAYDVLMVLTTSRFARDRAEAVRMKAEFGRTSTAIYFVMERMVSGARQTALLEGVKEVVDQEEQQVRNFWIAGGQRERFLAGKWVGAIPIGYRKAMVDFTDGTRGWGGGLEPDPAMAPVVRGIFDSFVTGAEPREIAYRLNAEGSRSLRGPWSRAQVVKVLRNPVYAGVMVRYRTSREGHYYPEDDEHDGRREMPAPWEPIIDPVLWQEAQGVLDGRRRTEHGRRGGRLYPLSPVLRCAKCGHRFTGAHGGGGRRYYRCGKRAADGSCDAPGIRAEDAEATFARWLASIHLPDDWREEIARTRELPPDDSGRSRLEERLRRLRDLYSWGDMDEAAYRAEVAETRQQLALLARPAVDSVERVAETLSRLGQSWLGAPTDTQARVASLILRAGIVEDGHLVALVVRGDLRPLVELCVPSDSSLYAAHVRYTFG